MADTEEVCARVNILNLDETTDKNNNSDGNDPEQEQEQEHEIQGISEENGEKEEDQPTEKESEDTANAQLAEDEVDGPQIEKLTVEAQDESKKSDMAEENAKKSGSKFKLQSMGVAQGGTTFAPQSLIDVPDYGYSIDGGFQEAW